MNERNKFMDSYKKNMEDRKAPEEGTPAGQTEPGYRYEEKSGFVKPHKRIPDLPAPAAAKKILPFVIAAVVLVGAVITLMLLLNGGVEVIDLTAWKEGDAQLWANEKGVRLQVEERYSDAQEAGLIVSQDLPEGTLIQPGDFLRLVVSLGHDLSVTLPLPDLMSMTKEEVEAWAAENFMTKVRITAEYSDTVPAGHVIRYEVNDDTVVDEVSRNTPVYVIVSKGAEDESAILVTVPDFKVKTISECYAFASENGILLEVEEQYDDYVPRGSVISQSVKAEEEVAKGTQIILTVSKGKMILVPDFSDYSKENAAVAASGLGISVSVKEKYSSYSAGAFISQSIAAGSVYEPADIVELSYSIGNKIVVSSFAGQTRDAIEAWAKALNEQGARITISATSTNSNAPKGTILYQDKANTVIGVKTTIRITVSLGKVVFVPDFVAAGGSGYDKAMTRDKAISICEEINIIPVFVMESKAGRLPGEIWYQSVAAGTEISEGSTITLKYTPADVKVTVPDFTTGMTEKEIRSGDYLKSLDIRFVTGDESVDGKVTAQSLTAGTKVAAGSVITLTVGPDS